MELRSLPAGWNTAPLERLCAFITKGTTPTTYGYKWESSGIPFLRSECVGEGGLNLCEATFISPKAHASLRRSRILDGDILITITGYVGRVVMLSGVGEANMNQHIARIRVVSDDAYAGYVYHVLSQPRSRTYFASITTGQAYPQISLRQVRNAEIPLPPEKEQRAIATALSDVDQLLGALDRLIAKKRDLKQAAMQQLLTGQTRLPGFHGEWEVKRLGELASLKNGYAFKSETYTNFGTLKVVTIANVQDGYMTAENCNTIAFEPKDLQPHQRLNVGDILISMTGNVGRVCRVNEVNCLLNQRVGKLLPIGMDPDFLFAILRKSSFILAMIGAAKGGAQPNLSATDIAGHSFNIPKDMHEQTAIAEVLTDMDAEVAALEQRREKTRALKQTMMQELLTGRTRLV